LTGFKSGISFSSAGDVGRTKFATEWIVTHKGQAEPQVRDYLLQKAAQPRMSACFLIGLKASKALCMTPLLKKMRLVSEGRGGQMYSFNGQNFRVPYSFVIMHDPANYNICFAKPTDNSGLLMTFTVDCGQRQAVAMMDTGATHSFAQSDFLVSLGVPVRGHPQGIQLADGNSMTSKGTAKFRIKVARNCAEYRNFIICDQLIQEVDLILGHDLNVS
jgi:hypothetical protein